jgi:hexosaminidase
MQYLLALTMLAVPASAVSLWPHPTGSVSTGSEQLFVVPSFAFRLTGATADSSVMIKAADRYVQLINAAASEVPQDSAPLLASCSVDVSSVLVDAGEERKTLQQGMDEAYSLQVSGGQDAVCSIEARTVWGALRALETFTQLLTREGPSVVLSGAPVQISDAPAYSHRGLMIDTSRHYLDVRTIEHVVDTVSMSKMSVLHWHAVDAESFPLLTPSSPHLGEGAYSASAVYSMQDVAHLVAYAADRGVRLIVEVNSPGHAASWTHGYPDVMAKCFKKYSYNYNDFAVNPTLDKTYDVVGGAIADVLAQTQDAFMHLGGDEVVYGCWDEDADIAAYKEEHGIDSNDQLYGMYISRAGGMAGALGATPVHWQEAFIAFDRSEGAAKDAFQFQPGTAFQVWQGDGTLVSDITAANFSCIASPNAYWYLDYATSTWDVMYYYDPAASLTDTQRMKLMGGEAVMFAEMVDGDNFDSQTQPRATAVAERLWSDRSALPDDASANPRYDTDKDETKARLMDMRCRMRGRGVRAAPIAPDYCATNFV